MVLVDSNKVLSIFIDDSVRPRQERKIRSRVAWSKL